VVDEIICECGQRLTRTESRETCPTCGIEHLALTANDSASLTLCVDVAVAKFQGGKAVGIRMSGDSGREISADTQSGAATVTSIRARRRTNEANVPEVARIFRDHLNSTGWTWQDPEICSNLPSREERGVDFILQDSTSRMDCQVVRPPCKRDQQWQRTDPDKAIDTKHESNTAAEDIKSAIGLKERKIPPAQRGSITLVIDSIETPALLLGHAPSEFLRVHGGWAESLGFAAIWLVGPTCSLTIQLA
jgi:hypothetical protein